MAISTLSLTLRSASSGVTLKSNSMNIVENPSTEVEVNLSMPEIEPISFSSGRVNSFSMSIGEFPGYGVPT